MSLDHDGGAPLDGNAAAGLLSEIFAPDVTTATIVCIACEAAAQVGEIRVYGGVMGAVFRCGHCDNVLMRVVRSRGALWLEMKGARSFRVRAPSQ